jgi:hypothetical protein
MGSENLRKEETIDPIEDLIDDQLRILQENDTAQIDLSMLFKATL